jgi:general stress protein 26
MKHAPPIPSGMVAGHKAVGRDLHVKTSVRTPTPATRLEYERCSPSPLRDYQSARGLHRRCRLLRFRFMSPTTLTDSEKRERLKKLMDDFDTAMLVTRTEDGGLRSRPLSIVHNHDDEKQLYFSTSIDSPKARELEADPRVNVCMQNKRQFVSVTGVARLVNDRALIDKLWSEAWRIWFPEGKDDPFAAHRDRLPQRGRLLGRIRPRRRDISVRHGQGVRHGHQAELGRRRKTRGPGEVVTRRQSPSANHQALSVDEGDGARRHRQPPPMYVRREQEA